MRITTRMTSLLRFLATVRFLTGSGPEWDLNIQCDNLIEARRQGTVVVNKGERKFIIIDIAVPGDGRISEREKEKIKKC